MSRSKNSLQAAEPFNQKLATQVSMAMHAAAAENAHRRRMTLSAYLRDILDRAGAFELVRPGRRNTGAEIGASEANDDSEVCEQDPLLSVFDDTILDDIVSSRS